jgi:hypothetical protein
MSRREARKREARGRVCDFRICRGFESRFPTLILCHFNGAAFRLVERLNRLLLATCHFLDLL